MTEIEFTEGRYQIRHDGIIWTIDEARDHIRNNGHSREIVGYFAFGIDQMKRMNEIASLFDEDYRSKQELKPRR